MVSIPKSNASQFVFTNQNGGFRICLSDRRVGSNGFLLGDNPFTYSVPATLLQIVLVSYASRLFYYILRPMRTPKLVCSVLAGIFIGPSILGRSDALRDHLFPPRQAQFLSTISAMGGIYSIFFISLKMDVVTTFRAAKKTWRFGVIPSLCSFIVMWSLLYLYDARNNPGLETLKGNSFLFLCFASLSNFAVIADGLAELNLITSELGQIALSSTILNDAIQWTIIILKSLANRKIQSSIEFVFIYWGLIFLCIFILRPMLQKLARDTPIGKPVKEVYIVFILLAVLVMAALTDILGLSFLQGPLLFGLIMPNGPPLGTTIIDRSQDIISQVLMPLFFTYVGFNADSTKIQNVETVWKLESILVAGVLAKLLGCMVVSRTYKIKPKQGFVLGLVLNMKGIVEIIVYVRMKRYKVLDVQNFSHMMIFVIGTTAIISPIVEKLYKPHSRVEKSIERGGQIRTIQDNPKNSQFHIVSCIHNEGNVHSIIALLEASYPNESSPICVYVIHLIELLGKSTPVLLPFDKHKRRSVSANHPDTNHIMRAFENYSLNSYGPVNVLPYVNIAPYKNMHVSICNLIQDKSIPFLLIPFHQDNKMAGNRHLPAIRSLNSELQARAPCTVGVLVDKNSHPQVSTSEFCFHVGIFFIGGPDDREALALGCRMSENENVMVSFYHFLLKNKSFCIGEDETPVKLEDEAERMLDEHFIDEFKAKNIGNLNVVCHEIEVNDGIQVLEEIRDLEGNYDLVMVGKQHDVGILNNKEMSEFIENVEMLGMFGDMLASNEFCNGRVSVLVMQCGGRPKKDFERTGSSFSKQSSA